MKDQPTEGNKSRKDSHFTHKAVGGIKRCAVEVMDHSLSGFGMLPGDRAIVVLTHDVLEGHLVLVKTPRGVLLRIMDHLPIGSPVLLSGNPGYPVEFVSQGETNVMGYVVYYERKENRKSLVWRQHELPGNVLEQAREIHYLNLHQDEGTYDITDKSRTTTTVVGKKNIGTSEQ